MILRTNIGIPLDKMQTKKCLKKKYVVYKLYELEPEAGSDTGHGQGDQVVQVAVGRVGQLQGSKKKRVELAGH